MDKQREVELIEHWSNAHDKMVFTGLRGRSKSTVEIEPEECSNLHELYGRMARGNWAAGAAFYIKDREKDDAYCFINQVNGGSEWRVFKNELSFESLTVRSPGSMSEELNSYGQQYFFKFMQKVRSGQHNRLLSREEKSHIEKLVGSNKPITVKARGYEEALQNMAETALENARNNYKLPKAIETVKNNPSLFPEVAYEETERLNNLLREVYDEEKLQSWSGDPAHLYLEDLQKAVDQNAGKLLEEHRPFGMDEPIEIEPIRDMDFHHLPDGITVLAATWSSLNDEKILQTIEVEHGSGDLLLGCTEDKRMILEVDEADDGTVGLNVLAEQDAAESEDVQEEFEDEFWTTVQEKTENPNRNRRIQPSTRRYRRVDGLPL